MMLVIYATRRNIAPMGAMKAYIGEILNFRIAFAADPANNATHADKFISNIIKCIWFINLD